MGGLIRIAAAALLALAFAEPVGSPAWAQEKQESGLIEIVNKVRADRNLTPLRYEPRLTQIARELTDAIYGGQRIDNLGDGLDVLMRRKGYPHRLAGANYATTSGSAQALVEAWIDDRGRNSFILSPDAKEIGVAYKSSVDSLVPNIAPNIWAVVVADPARPAEDGWADRVISLVNQFRLSNGLEPLKRNAFLDRAAMAQSRDMLARDFFSHINPDGKDPGDRATAAGYRWSRILENLAVGQTTAREAVEAWVRSKDGHREAMLDPAVTEVGVGYVFAPFDPGRIEALHYWSMSLGRPRQ